MLVFTSSETFARVRLENICTVYGQHEVKLTGIGLVVGLSGTGDGGKDGPSMRALARILNLMNTPTDSKELKDSKNVALVFIEATVPRTGLRRGQKIDCYVSSLNGAKSLAGGRLLVTPVETAEVENQEAVGLASGPITIEGKSGFTSGRIAAGVSLRRNFTVPFINKERGQVVTLLLDATHSSFRASSEVARVVNQEFSFEAGNKQIAKAVQPGVIEIQVPEYRSNSPVEFIAQVLEISIENPQTQARVVVNEKTETVIVTGEVEISPVLVLVAGLSVQVGGADVPVQPFRVLVDKESRQSTTQLRELVEALNELQVPTADVIKILREIHRSGKLHAVFDDH